jgi:peroxiredoxin
VQLRDHEQDFAVSGADVLAIGLGPTQRAGAFCRAKRIPYTCLTDPSGRAHKSYGLHRGVARTLDPRNAARFAALNTDPETKQTRAGGNVWQQGGAFVIDTAGVVRYAHRSANPGDHAPVDELLAAAADAARRPA